MPARAPGRQGQGDPSSRAPVQLLRGRHERGAYGNSAGGHLALLLGLTEPPPLDVAEPHADQSSRVQAVVSDSGPLDLALQHRQNQLRTVIDKSSWAAHPRARGCAYQLASPAEQIGAKVPPLLLLYGEVDGQVEFYQSI